MIKEVHISLKFYIPETISAHREKVPVGLMDVLLQWVKEYLAPVVLDTPEPIMTVTILDYPRKELPPL